MYKNNSQVISKFSCYSQLQLSCKLEGKCHAIGYYSYTRRYLKLSSIFSLNNTGFKQAQK